MARGNQGGLTQLRRGVIEYCVLAMLAQGKSYGFDLARALGDVGALSISQGTVYPMLSRLNKDGRIAATWVESEEGPPRKYYELTDEGHAALQAFVREWSSFRNAVDRLLSEQGN